jgi:2-polyprenyl-6-methoxyphenol hydroxylase-like FAD-dependent oxidoreductase
MGRQDFKRDAEVLIIGAGPTGLALALELHLQNVSFRILDSTPVRSDKSRALALQPRTLELLSRHQGIVPELLQLGKKNIGLRLFVDKRYCFELDFSNDGKDNVGFSDTEYATPLMASQAEIEDVMEKHLEELGVEVQRPLIAETLTQDSEGVTLHATNSATGEKEELRAKYLAGCDGAHSFVRKAIGISFPGSAYASEYTLIDCRLNWQHPRDRLTMFIGKGFMMCIPFKNNVFRLIAMRPSHPSSTAPTIEDFRESLKEFVPGECQISDPQWLSNFRLSHRIVDRFQEGRCFLAGDAAHIHSPAGGQGMNTGIQDSINLGWKIGRVLRGEVSKELLTTYNDERRKVGASLVSGTDKYFDFMTATNWLYVWLRNRFCQYLMPLVMSSRARRAKSFRFISQLAIRYRQSQIVSTDATYQGKLKGGDRAPDGKINRDNGPSRRIASRTWTPLATVFRHGNECSYGKGLEGTRGRVDQGKWRELGSCPLNHECGSSRFGC